MTAWEAIKLGFGKFGAGLWLILKTWKWSLGVIILVFMLITNTFTGMHTGKYWDAYRDGVIKHVVTADHVILEEVDKLRANNWQVVGLRTEGFGHSFLNFFTYLSTYNFIITQLLIIWTSFYLIWLLLAGDHFLAIMAFENVKATITTIIIMIVLYGTFNIAFMKVPEGVTSWSFFLEVLKSYLPWNTFKGMGSLIVNLPKIV